jgi:murein DD-endopeptidase MepM/ murein hydrolase activator NlpD
MQSLQNSLMIGGLIALGSIGTVMKTLMYFAGCADPDHDPFRMGSRSMTSSVFVIFSFMILTTAPASANVPVTPVPPGYGHYCSLTYASGGWAFGALPASDSDPCGDILKTYPGGVIQRAGLWNTAGANNVMVRCDNDLRIYRAYSDQPLNIAFAGAAGKKNCIFIVAPTELRIFGHPWGSSLGYFGSRDDDVDQINISGFNYDLLNQPWDVSEFGQPQNPNKPALQVDRYGRQQPRTGSLFECLDRGEPAGCTLNQAFEGAYDWGMPVGKPLIAVADGLVVGAVARDISEFNCFYTDKFQQEVFIEHQVGTGIYAERFISAYHHMSSTLVHTGDIVHLGDLIAFSGTSGCSSGPHLDFSVLRLTNLSGARSYQFATELHGYGINGIQGAIDPFGWSAPQQVDPWAWKSLNAKQPYEPLPPVPEPGAFSIYLWLPFEAPPTY